MRTTWDLTHLYKTTTEWENDYQKLLCKVEELKNNLQLLFENGKSFEDFLSSKTEIDILTEKLYCYAKRHIDIDNSLIDYEKMLNSVLKIHEDVQIINNTFENKLINNYDDVIKLLKHESIKGYSRYLTLILRKKEHIIHDQESLNKYIDYNKDNSKLRMNYQKLFSSTITFKEILLNGEKITVNRTNYNNLMLDKK